MTFQGSCFHDPKEKCLSTLSHPKIFVAGAAPFNSNAKIIKLMLMKNNNLYKKELLLSENIFNI